LAEKRVLTKKHEVGVMVIVVALCLILMPSTTANIAANMGKTPDYAYSMLIWMVYIFGIIAVVVGLYAFTIKEIRPATPIKT
jgi:hypothetical protein